MLHMRNNTLNIGELLYTKGDISASIPYFQKYLELTPNSYVGYDKLSYVYLKLNEFNKSITVNKQAKVSLPGHLDPYINIGRTYMAMERKDSARIWLQKADTLSGGTNTMVKTLLVDLEK